MNAKSGHISTFKVVTLALLAFYGIATGRSLLPEVCTTLAALSDGITVENSDGCCSSSHETSSQAQLSVPSSDYAPCALCNLTESLSNPTVFVHELPANIAAEPSHSVSSADPALPHVWSPAGLRAPPAYA